MAPAELYVKAPAVKISAARQFADAKRLANAVRIQNKPNRQILRNSGF